MTGTSTAVRRSSAPAHTVRLGDWLLVAAVFMVGAWLSLGNLRAANESVDEGIYTSSGWAYVHGDFSANLEHPPTAKYLYGLAQVLAGQGLYSARLMAGLLAFGVGVVLWLWLRDEVGWRLALLPTAIWFFVPRTLYRWTDRVDRYVMLEPAMAFFTVVAFACAWRWFRTRSSAWAVLSGVAFALAITSKISAAATLPALLVLASAGALRAAVWFTAGLLATAVAVYVPPGTAALRYMVRFQSEHNDSGHLVAVGSYVGEFPPWWANAWYMNTAVGVAGMVVLVAGTAAALVLAPQRRLVGMLAAAVGMLLVLHMLVMNVALSQYWYAWLWPMAAMSGLGTAALLRREGVSRAAGFALVAVLAVSGAVSLVQVTGQRPSGMALVDSARANDPGPDGDILVAGAVHWDWQPFLAETPATAVEQVPDMEITAIVVKRGRARPPDPRVLELVEREGRRIDIDDVELYLFDGPLRFEDGRLIAP